jgi:hypothetical protein
VLSGFVGFCQRLTGVFGADRDELFGVTAMGGWLTAPCIIMIIMELFTAYCLSLSLCSRLVILARTFPTALLPVEQNIHILCYDRILMIILPLWTQEGGATLTPHSSSLGSSGNCDSPSPPPKRIRHRYHSVRDELRRANRRLLEQGHEMERQRMTIAMMAQQRADREQCLIDDRRMDQRYKHELQISQMNERALLRLGSMSRH